MVSEAVIASRLRQLVGSVFVVLLLIACGYGVTHGYAHYMLVLAAVCAVALLAVAQRGAYVGVLLIAAMNGIPFIDTSTAVASHVTGEDLAVLGLIAAGVCWPIADRAGTPQKLVVRILMWCGAALLLWWAFTVVRTSVNGYTSILVAANYGRDFGFFAMLLIVLPRVRLSDRDLSVMIGVLGVAVCLFSVGQIVTVLGFASPKWLLHPTGIASGSTLGLTRLYAAMNDLLVAGVAAAIGAVLLARDRRTRRIATPVAILVGTSFVLELTRARWIGLVVALLVVTVRILTSSDRKITTILRRRLGALTAGLTGAGAIAVVTSPQVVLTGPFAQRFLSIFTDLQSSTSTVATRVKVVGAMTTLLAGKWLLGVGLIPPSAYYFGALPDGSLRNTDVGVLNGLTTMGIIGTVLIYLPVVAVLVHVLRRRAWGAAIPYPWLRYSSAIWIVATFASSVSIITLFSLPGLAMTAVILVIAIHGSVSGVGDAGKRASTSATAVSALASTSEPSGHAA